MDEMDERVRGLAEGSDVVLNTGHHWNGCMGWFCLGGGGLGLFIYFFGFGGGDLGLKFGVGVWFSFIWYFFEFKDGLMEV